ncbi:indole-3-glycerol-phosphate synthase [Streptomyces scopuliridis]|uniref:Indole-3-glycerol-phosphate synthase n=1 Tax=Streptomyces scopuliridis TaxID=452529 RepID=A0ACD4ZVT3_9ACTN|nr:indole-3-glycerol-phosphate synthase [Streptomyces scopuliridis]WSB38071.1 indole-3-glycerol-phosphate synthase [Streptomyces scopuliridis]WSC02504.1 indole-3-glycerol-phosphate synthase [Streptomyces scopuliridis]WSC03963.1 indole-3-glycerol-phosphate synthase [Streptomyces scopuliridis]
MTARFLEALLAADRPLVMEIKRRDAHGYDLLGGRTPAAIVESYEAAGAPCISVVTGRWFGGTTGLLRDVAALTDLPLLQKDFITRKDQLSTAGELGASAVLLTAALLPRSSMRTLITASLVLGLTPFVEVTEESELDGLPHAEECVVAVNNKDIKAKERDRGDLDRSLALLPAVRASGTRCPVSASAIDGPLAAAKLLDAGYAGLLVGTSLLRTDSAAGWVDRLDRARTRPAGRPN